MAEKSSFFPGKPYTTFDWAAYFASFIGNGVFPNPSTNLQVISNNDMTVTLKAGKAFIGGYFYENDADLVLTIENADGVLKRKDNIVIRRDLPNNKITAMVVKGSFASSPLAPDLQRTVDYFDLKVAEVFVNAGAISILQSNITDSRLEPAVCGIVTQTVETVDTTTLYEQIQNDLENFNTQEKGEFLEWFDEMKNQLSTDAAGNLQNQLDLHKNNKYNPHEVTQMQIGPINTNLLINSDFRSPVNQRGKTTFKNEYGIDRWISYNAYATVVAGGLSLAQNALFTQYFDVPIKTLITGSDVCVTINAGVNDLIFKGYVNPTGTTIIENNDAFQICFTYGGKGIQILAKNAMTIKYMKLELGSIQTPFVPRLFDEELLLCKRYYRTNYENYDSYTALLMVVTAYSLHATFSYGENMRIKPTLKVWSSRLKDRPNCVRNTNTGEIEDLGTITSYGNSFAVGSIAVTNPLTGGYMYDCIFESDAEIY